MISQIVVCVCGDFQLVRPIPLQEDNVLDTNSHWKSVLVRLNLWVFLFHRDKMSHGRIDLLFLSTRICSMFSRVNPHGRIVLAYSGVLLLNRFTFLPPPFCPLQFFAFLLVGNSAILPIFRNCKCHLVDTCLFPLLFGRVFVVRWGTFFVPSEINLQNRDLCLSLV